MRVNVFPYCVVFLQSMAKLDIPQELIYFSYPAKHIHIYDYIIYYSTRLSSTCTYRWLSQVIMCLIMSVCLIMGFRDYPRTIQLYPANTSMHA